MSQVGSILRLLPRDGLDSLSPPLEERVGERRPTVDTRRKQQVHRGRTCLSGFSPGGNPPALPEDSWSLTVPAIARHFGLEHGPFPLTPTLSPRRGSLIVRAREHSVCSDRPRDGIGFSLSPRERVGVRGKGTLARHTLFAWGLTSGHRPSAHGFEPSPISSLRLCRISANLFSTQSVTDLPAPFASEVALPSRARSVTSSAALIPVPELAQWLVGFDGRHRQTHATGCPAAARVESAYPQGENAPACWISFSVSRATNSLP
jgi:hypothetical protein